MDTMFQVKSSANELHQQIQEHLEELAQATDEARTSQEILNYLDFVSRLHDYSPGNTFLILLKKPDATYVAGFNKWKSLNRWVRKGEQGIPILAPMLVKQEVEDGIEKQFLRGFRVVFVFDVAQTDGAPLPPPPDWKSPQKNEELNNKLTGFAKSRGISVTFKNLAGEIQGLSKGGAVEINLSAGTKTLVHEIAHELMHKDENKYQDRALKELEAESVAYIVSRHFGLESLNSPNYIALHGMTSEQIISHMAKISTTAHSIITAIYCDS